MTETRDKSKAYRAAPPPFFTPSHAASIVDRGIEHPDADGILVFIPAQSTLAAASLKGGLIVYWVTESPASADDFEARFAQLQASGQNWKPMTMHTDREIPLAGSIAH